VITAIQSDLATNKCIADALFLSGSWASCQFGFGFTKLTVVLVFGSVLCCLMCMTLEMAYFHAELVQLIVDRSDSELEVQRHGMKKNTLTVFPIILQDELWMRQREKPSPDCRRRFFENRTAETKFLVFEFWGRFGSFFRKSISEIFIRFRTPLLSSPANKNMTALFTQKIKSLM